MKFAMSFFSILVCIIGAVLFAQFQVYSDQLKTTEETFGYSQEIEIVYRGESLDIRQHFKNLPNQKVSIKWPTKAENPSCFIETEYSCSRLSEDLSAFETGENRTQSVSYIIPLNGGLKSRQLMQDVFVSLNKGDVKFSTVHISTDSSIDGQWVTGLPLIGQQSLPLVNYSMFSGTGEVKDLYWQAGDLALQQATDVISIYGKQPTSKAFNEKLATVNFLNDEHIAIVNGENRTGAKSDRILFLPNVTVAQIKQDVILAQIEAEYDFVNSPQWLKEVIASFLTGNAFGSERVAEIVETLTNQMTDEQLAEWTKQLEALKGQQVSPEILDEALSTVFGIHTGYLSMNVNSSEVYPFLFNDKRDVYLNTYKQDAVNVIFKDGLVLYSAEPLLNALGYKAAEGKNGYYVTSETRSFRFPVEPGFYVFNQRRYNTISEPIVQIAGEYYVEESWLQRLFLVDIQKKDEKINLTTVTAQ
ncbi:RNA polymerase II [Solibacillus sp. CAU 1738]|uniref:RNA polymerase II n=1 Tax=Solibacillus sp. CAU 1738 TaxID=3140363 RepID=UPI00325FFBC2